MPRKRSYQRSSGLGGRAALFGVLAVALIGAALYSVWPKERAFIELGPAPSPSAMDAMGHGAAPPVSGSADLTMRVDMSGFSPAQLPVAAGRAQRLMLVNPDNSMHSDGGGIHQFAVPKLGIDVKVPPLTNMIVTLPAAEPGEYAFYCDTCCGGKENPSMQGVLKVGA
ncbi:MAG: cupredoxin domain-containing protein [Chloroflexi bacterium]|nr:cupredoxin domain-containing protein [Chloroflexota bacterium]